MVFNKSLSLRERAALSVWEYPVSTKYSKIWSAMKEAGLPDTLEDGINRVRSAPKDSFAFIGDFTVIKYLVLTSCDLMIVGEEFSKKPLAMAVQQGSPLKSQLNRA